MVGAVAMHAQLKLELPFAPRVAQLVAACIITPTLLLCREQL
jgi:hypothetical protein